MERRCALAHGRGDDRLRRLQREPPAGERRRPKEVAASAGRIPYVPRRALTCSALLLGLAAAGPVAAQAGLALPLDLHGVIARASEHGCSQSFATTSGQASLHLVAPAHGAATLTIDGHVTNTMGSSRFSRDRERTVTTAQHLITWTGTARSVAGELLADFTQRASAEMLWAGFGTGPLPAPTTAPIVARLRCHAERVDVVPAIPTSGERASAMPLVACGWEGDVVAPFDRYLDAGAAFLLSAGPGVRTSYQHRDYQLRTERTVRLLDADAASGAR